MDTLTVYGTMAIKLGRYAADNINVQLQRMLEFIPDEERLSPAISYLNKRVEVIYVWEYCEYEM